MGLRSFDNNKYKRGLICLGLLFSIISWNLYGLFLRPMISKSAPPERLQVKPSSSAYQFTRLLKDKQYLPSPKIFLFLIRSIGWSRSLKAGIYEIKPGETVMQFVPRVLAGDVLIQNFTIIEGSIQEKVTQDLMKADALDYHEKDWLLLQGKHPKAEGLLLADTYQYGGGSSSFNLLNQAHQHLNAYLDRAWANRSPNLPYHSAYELLIAASIIEKETALPQEKTLISGVMVNRLNKKMPLQMDPTVIYGMGSDYKGKLSHQDLQIDTPYNSYRRIGLPPTPIAMVGKKSIDAAAHPQKSSYLYFVAKGDGSHQFSETYEQQKQAIRLYKARNF